MKKPIKILVVEDKMIVSRDIAHHLEELNYQVTGMARSGREALEKLVENPPDLAMLDINLKGDMDGIELAERIAMIHPIPIIYLTAQNDSATLERAKKTLPSAYLVKPYKKDDFGPAIDLAIYQFTQNRITTEPESDLSIKIQTPEPVRESVFVKSDHCYEKLHVADIRYIKAEGSYVKIFSTNRNYLQTVNLNSFSRQLNHPDLVRIHRSYVINLQHLTVYEEGRVFIGDSEIPIGKTYRGELVKYLQFIRTGT